MKQKKPIREKNSGRAGSTGAKSKPSLLTQPPKGRGRVTYERLMKAAGELLGEEGFERLSTNAICARAGLTPPALYRYFRDK